MHYVLQGKIAKAHPYQLDKSLTVEGAGAEAQAVGKAIEEVKKHSELKDKGDQIKGHFADLRKMVLQLIKEKEEYRWHTKE